MTEIKLTVPTLERLIAADPAVLLTLSHSAAKEIATRYQKVLVESDAVKEVLKKLEETLALAKTNANGIAVRIVENQIGEWKSAWTGNKFVLRPEAERHIKENFEKVLTSMFEKWLTSTDVNALLEVKLKSLIERKLKEHLDKSLGEYLKDRSY